MDEPTDPKCILCRLMLLDSQSSKATRALVGAAQAGWQLGERRFRKALCATHEQQFDDLKAVAANLLVTVTGQIAK